MQRFNRLLVPALVLSFAASALGDSLDVGDLAPALKSSKWLKGAPITKFEKGKVYVVEFWATWCTPCKTAMPHLSELARKYRGKVEIIGVDAYESSELPKVASFVQKQGATMDYRVVADASGDRTHLDWMKAAGESGIPTSFVIGKDGRVAWIGSPAGLDAILPKALDGTLNVAEEKARRAENLNPSNAVSIALGDRDYAKVVSLVDAEIAKHPAVPGFGVREVYMALSHFDVPQLRKRFRADVERTQGDFGIYNWLTIALGDSGLSAEAYRLGVEVVGEAMAKQGPTLLMAARGAEMASRAGDWAKAVELQTAAIAAAESGNASAERLTELRKDLEAYKNKAG